MRAVFARVLGGTRRLELALDSGGARVGIERARLEQALLHVLENARDATAADGCVRVETRLVELEPGFVARHAGTRGGRHVRVEVRDDGAALSPNEAAHAFDAFRGTRGGGGIGLALVRGIVGASDGCVEATSEPGRGVAIRLYLPVTAAAGAPAAAREVDSG